MGANSNAGKVHRLPLPHFRTGIYVEAQIIELDLRPGPVELSDESNFAKRGVGSQRQMSKFCKGNLDITAQVLYVITWPATRPLREPKRQVPVKYCGGGGGGF